MLVVAGVVAYFISKRGRAERYGAKTTSDREDQILSMVEDACVEHMRKFPQLNDESIAQLVRDDLLNHRVKDPDAFRWATPETVGRMRRNIARAAMATLEAGTPATPTKRRAPVVEVRDEEQDADDEEAPPPKPRPKRKVAETEDKGEEPAGALVVRLQRCGECGTKNRGDAYSCRKCRALLPRARE